MSCINAPQPLSNDFWSIPFQKVATEYIKLASQVGIAICVKNIIVNLKLLILDLFSMFFNTVPPKII